MARLNRRRFLETTAAVSSSTLLGSFSPGSLWAADRNQKKKLPVAAIITEYRNNSHADVIIGKILEGFQQDGGPGPALRVVSMYTDQVPKTDMSRDLARKHGFQITETIAEAITLGSGKVAVAGVLSIGEHGNYPHTPDTKQHMYPRRRFFDEITATFRRHGQVVPVFNDKHMAYSWKDAAEIADIAQEMKIPLMAGSSIPVAWRIPPLSLPKNCVITEALAHGYGDLEAYGFHALEGLQCMVERRRGGETGVESVQAVRGEAIDQAAKQGRWSRELLARAVASTREKNSPATNPLSKDAVLCMIRYRDGLQAALAMRTGMAGEFAFACRLQGEKEPRANWFKLQEGKPFAHFGYLVRAIEHLIHTGKPAYPMQRTLLTTGILDAMMHSLAEGDRLVETPHLSVKYQGNDWPFASGVPLPPRRS